MHLSSQLLLPPLLGEDLARNRQDSLEAFSSFGCVLAEPVDCDLLDAVLDLLPATAHGDDLSSLVEHGLSGAVDGSVSDSLLHREQFAPGQVLRAHGDGLLARVDVRDFVDQAGIVGAEERLEPCWQSLLAGDEALSAKLWQIRSARATSDNECIFNLQYQCLCRASGSVHLLR